MEKGALLTLSLPCNTNKKLPMLLERVERSAIDNGNGGVIHNGMSLFQDLKLKRRKVDSRCSSDGESIGTSESASSLSPDQPQGGEGSPKAEEKRCLTPEELVAPSPATDSNGFPSKFFYMNLMKNDPSGARKIASTNNNNYDTLKGSSNGLSKGNNNGTTVTTTANVLVVKSEPGEDSSRSTPSSSPGLEEQQLHRKTPVKRREMSPPKENGHTNGTTNGHHGQQNGHKSDTESVTSIKSEKRDNDSSCEEKGDEKMDTNDQETNNGLPMSLASSPRSILSSASSTGSHRSSPPRPLSHPPSSSSPRRSPPQGQREMSPSTLIITKGQPNNNSSSQRSSPAMSVSSRGGSPPGHPMMATHFLPPHHQLHPSNNNGLSHHQMHHPSHGPVPGLFHATQLHARLTAGDTSRRDQQRETSNGSPMVHVEIRNLSDKHSVNNTSEPPLSVVTSTSLSFHQSSMYRINGVRPEVISGGAVTPSSGNNGGPGGNSNSSGSSQGQIQPSSHPPTGIHNMSSHSLQLQQQNGGHGGVSNGQMTNGHNHHHHNGSGGMHLHHNVSHLPFQTRKSPTHLMSRSPNSSPSNSSSSGSIQHSPGSTGSSGGCSTVGGTIIAGGNIGMVNSSNAGTNGTHHVNLSRTPTVIMGEAGGVRTMLWSQPGQNIPNPALEIGLGGGGGASPPGSGGNLSISSGASSNGSYAGSLHNGSGGNSPPGNQLNNNNVSNNGPNSNNNSNSNGHHNPAIQKGVLSMERLWANEALNLSTGASNTTNGHGGLGGGNHNVNGQTGSGPTGQNQDDDDYEQPMICMICEDRATGLHYGIITCEGCKGFFKRTVQNRRVYTCVADGTCEITKAQRNRCQYCRFKKCIEQGMVLQAVREDRMPGGRNSGAVYNLYKVPVKYRKHKKGNRGAAQNGKGDKQNNTNSTNNNNNPTTNLSSLTLSNNNTNNSSGQTQSSSNNNGNSTSMLPPHPGNILMAALTRDPKEAMPLRREHVVPFDQAANMINALVQCDNFHDIAALHNWEELLEARGDLSDKLCQMGDSIVYRLVQWTKRLPFYSEVPVEVHTRVLTHKWHELLVLTTSAWHAMHSPAPPPGMSAEEEALDNLKVLQSCLQAMMGRSLTLEQLKQDVGQMVERLTFLTRTFRRLGIRLEEYVTLKVIAMLQNTGTKSDSVNQIQERYIKVLRTFLEMTVPSQPNRLTELLRCLPEVQAAASLLLESKMFYVPFLLNSALLQR